MTRAALGLAVLLLLWSHITWAQPTRNADLSVEASLSSTAPAFPGEVLTLTITMRNNGPEALTAVGAVTDPYPILEFAKFTLFPIGPSPCVMAFEQFVAAPGSGFTSSALALISAGALLPGQSRTCTVGLQVTQRATGTHLLGMRVNDGQAFVNDPVSSNNQTVVSLAFALAPPSPIPSLDQKHVTLLGLLLVLFALGAARSNG